MAKDYKQLYIDMLIQYDEDLCSKCKHYLPLPCDVDDNIENCSVGIEGDASWREGKLIYEHWSCQDMDWGDCPFLENTPCHGCCDDGMGHFELNED